MNNLQLLHCIRGKIDPGQGCRFIAIDNLTPAVYLQCGTSLYSLDQNRKLSLHIDMVAENILSRDGSERVVGMEFLTDLQLICICTSEGNIFTFDPLVNKVDPVAFIPSNIIASCWSPDYEVLIMATASDSILMVNRDFDVVNQLELHPASFGTDDLITVGWGKKETQFHGSEGKQAALTKATLDSTAVLDWDDYKVRISWRGDGQYFAVSAVDPAKGRTIRVWSREGVHCSTNERVDGVGQCLAWKPSGSLIATSQNKGDASQVIFYERNGLRHGEFILPFNGPDCQVQEVAWNRDSTILAVWSIGAGDTSYLQLYTTSNYHWYCKLTYSFPLECGPTGWCWDPDYANTLHVVFADGHVTTYVFAFVVHRNMIDGQATVCVVDGKTLHVTDFNQVVIPPPMSQWKIPLSSLVNEVVFTREGKIACVTGNGLVILTGPDKSKNALKPEILNQSSLPISSLDVAYHFQSLRNGLLAYVMLSNDQWALVIVELLDSQWIVRKIIPLEEGVYQLVPILNSIGSLAILELIDGSFVSLTDECEITPCSAMPRSLASVAWQVESLVVNGKLFVICLNDRFQLTISGDELCNDVTSFCLHPSFLLFTTTSHHLKCVPIDAFQSGLSKSVLQESEARNIERGAKLVSVVGNEAKVVLQLPRGNLETIYPRALVLSIAKELLDRFKYRDALIMMRRHRVNLNLLFDHSPKDFFENVEKFVNEINDQTLLNLFISDLKNEDVTETMYAKSYSRTPQTKSDGQLTKDKVNRVCEHLRTALWKVVPAHKYCTSILTSLVKMIPAQLDEALQVVKKFRDSGLDNKIIDEGLQHLLYYTDPNRLFDVALGTYDFDLVLMLAEKTQKDPKEYLPFLEELRSLEPSYRKYKIDVHLARFGKALSHLVEYAKDDVTKFDECLRFVKQHQLYIETMKLLPLNGSEYKAVCRALGDHLVSQRKYEEAALSYQIGDDMEKAVENYAKSLNWKMALGLARKMGMEESKFIELCDNFSRRLKDKQLFKDAALIEYEFLKDTKRCIGTLLEGAHWEEAVMRIYQSGELDLIDHMLVPTLKRSILKTVEAIEKQQSTFCQYKTRLTIVRANKKEHLREIQEKREFDDLLTETSTETGSSVTRSSASSSRSTSSRSKRAKKHERKKYSLKEGNAYEDYGLMKELREIVCQANSMQDDVGALLKAAALAGLREEGERLQNAYSGFRKMLGESMSEIWPETIEFGMLPGPVEDQMADDNASRDEIMDRLCSALDLHLKIKLDEHLIPPKPNATSAWALSFYE